MNVRQKAIAEKVIKLRYNSLIRQLGQAQTVVEYTNPDLTDQVYENGDWKPSELPAYLAELREARDEAAKEYEAAMQAENAIRAKNRRQALAMKNKATATLAKDRDEAIIRLNFDGEDEVRTLLSGLPTAKSVMESLGVSLSAPLTDEYALGCDKR